MLARCATVRLRATAANQAKAKLHADVHTGPLLDRSIEDVAAVFDTNTLIDHLETVRDFSADIERLGIPMKIIIPSVVLSELDGCVYPNLPALISRADADANTVPSSM